MENGKWKMKAFAILEQQEADLRVEKFGSVDVSTSLNMFVRMKNGNE